MGDEEKGDERGMKKKELFFLLKGHFRDKISDIYAKVEEEMGRKLKQSFVLNETNKLAIRSCVSKMDARWQEVYRKEDKFLNKFRDWLDTFVIQPADVGSAIEPFPESTPSTSRGGRPSIDFDGSSERTKRRKTEEIRSQRSSKELAYATRMTLRAEGKSDAAKVLHDITFGSPSKPSRYRQSLKLIREEKLSDDEALSLMIECRLSKNQYTMLSQISRSKKCKLYPNYSKVVEAKKKCYPHDSQLTFTESKACVSLQGLLDHTVNRIILCQSEVIKSLSLDNIRDLTLIGKWGCDGTSGQSNYKQKFNEADCSTDSSIFFTSLVPLEISSIGKQTDSKIIIWKNPLPSSTRFCRPFKIQFLHETSAVTQKEVEEVQEQEKNLSPFQCTIDGKEITVNYNLMLTMVDGKVCNSIANISSSLRCYLCLATSKNFNEIDELLERPISEDNLKFGISSLHGWIRFFECCLHISYRLETTKWQDRGAEEKKIFENKKKSVQKNFREKLGLIVDQPKPGYGSTNDGNTARRFFENSTISSSITGVDENLIKKFHTILQVISCGFDVNIDKFKTYAFDTALLFVQLYPWFYMPTSVHKILINGHIIIESALLPIGQMSEEAQESCNKFIKRYRQDFARKCSREKNLEDVFRRLLIASYPYISSLRKTPAKKSKSLSAEAIDLLVQPSVEHLNEDDDSSGENSSDCDSLDRSSDTE